MKKLFALTALASVMSSAAMVKPLDEPWLKPGEKLVCFGDSITAGKGYYIKHLRAALETNGITVVNAGRSGDKTPMALTRIGDVAAEKPDAVVIFFGANDSLVGKARWRDEPTVSPEAYRDNLIWMIHYLRLRGVKKFSIVAPPGCCEGVRSSGMGWRGLCWCHAAAQMSCGHTPCPLWLAGLPKMTGPFKL